MANGTRPKFEISSIREKRITAPAPRNRRRKIAASSLQSSSDAPNDRAQLSGLPTTSALQDPQNRAAMMYSSGPSSTTNMPTQTSQFFDYHLAESLASHLASLPDTPNQQAQAPGSSETNYNGIIDPRLP